MAQRIMNAIDQANTRSSPPAGIFRLLGVRDRVVVGEFGIDLTTQLADERLVVNGDRVNFLVGTSAIRELTSYGYSMTLIDDVEESYRDTDQSPRVRDYVPPRPPLQYPFDYDVVPNGRNMTDHIIATRVAAVVGSHPDYRNSGAGGFLDRINVPDALTADFSGMQRYPGGQIWTQVATSASGVSPGNIRIPVLADDWPVDHLVSRDMDALGVRRRDANRPGQQAGPGDQRRDGPLRNQRGGA